MGVGLGDEEWMGVYDVYGMRHCINTRDVYKIYFSTQPSLVCRSSAIGQTGKVPEELQVFCSMVFQAAGRLAWIKNGWTSEVYCLN